MSLGSSGQNHLTVFCSRNWTSLVMPSTISAITRARGSREEGLQERQPGIPGALSFHLHPGRRRWAGLPM